MIKNLFDNLTYAYLIKAINLMLQLYVSLLCAFGLNVIFMLSCRYLTSQLAIFKSPIHIVGSIPDPTVGPKINFVMANFHQIITCCIFVLTYILQICFNVPNIITNTLIETVIISLGLKIIYECTLFMNPNTSVTNNLIQMDMNLFYRVFSFGTILILHLCGSTFQCLNEMTNVIVLSIGSLYDINVLFDMEYIVLGERNGNKTFVAKICTFLKPYIIKIYFVSTVIDTILAIYYKFFAHHFSFFFLYKILTFCNIVIKIMRMAYRFDPSVPDFESASVKHLKKWNRQERT